jgi:hypothetical protein
VNPPANPRLVPLYLATKRLAAIPERRRLWKALADALTKPQKRGKN